MARELGIKELEMNGDGQVSFPIQKIDLRPAQREIVPAIRSEIDECGVTRSPPKFSV